MTHKSHIAVTNYILKQIKVTNDTVKTNGYRKSLRYSKKIKSFKKWKLFFYGMVSYAMNTVGHNMAKL